MVGKIFSRSYRENGTLVFVLGQSEESVNHIRYQTSTNARLRGTFSFFNTILQMQNAN